MVRTLPVGWKSFQNYKNYFVPKIINFVATNWITRNSYLESTLGYHLSFALEIARPWKKLSYNSKVPKKAKYIKPKKQQSLNDDGSGKCLPILTVLKLSITRNFQENCFKILAFPFGIFALHFVSLK